MLSNPDRTSGQSDERLEQFVQMEELIAQLREQVAALEQENLSLRSELAACQVAQASQERFTELEKAYAVLQPEPKS